MSWVTASKEGGYQCKAPSHPGRKKIIWACTTSLHYKKCKVSMRCDMPRGFVRRVNIFDVCVVLEDEHVLMTTQHNNRRYFIILLLLRSLTKHLLSHCCVARQRTRCLQEYDKVKTTPDVCDVICRSATWRERWRFWERVKMQCFCADISILKSSTNPR